MALIHKLIETRPYLTGFLSLIDITDDTTGRIWNERFNTPTYPTQAERVILITGVKSRIQDALDYEANDMNLPIDEDLLLEYYHSIKTDVILQIRQHPGCTLLQAKTYIETKYPNSLFDFNELYQQWLRISKCDNWSEFKTFVIDHKFIWID